uniref:MFS general substrate transporter n=1 Tax=Moniliophthora roreri TaxID=221103 RepID=A0A0W0EXW5_MONRR
MDSTAAQSTSETSPLLRSAQVKKPFYRARPLWLVPFAVTAALVRGMTLAPRVEVFTQLSCLALHHHAYNHTESPLVTLDSSLDPQGPHLSPILIANTGIPPVTPTDSSFNSLESNDNGEDDDPRKLPSPQCMSNAVVQAGAARLQTIMTTIMGLLSALSTGYWGHFSERHGRTRVLALSTLGLFLTDLTFILISTPGLPFSAHGHKLLIVSPFIEGALGGWSTLQSACSSYVSDCTSAGSRANIFSRFMGVLYLGLSIGPSIGGWIIKNGIPGIDRIGTPTGQGKSVTEVFWLAICCSFLNLLLVTFVLPESLSKEQRAAAAEQHRLLRNTKGKGRGIPQSSESSELDHGSDAGTDEHANCGMIRSLLSPLALFLPATVTETTASGMRKRKDWSLTYLALCMFLVMLSSGIYQVKYLYAIHVYGWGADQLSYYISFVGGIRALTLLLFVPAIIAFFKPKPRVPKGAANSQVKVKPNITKEHIAKEINFDLLLSQFCLCLDAIANFLISILPAPTYTIHHLKTSVVSSYQSEVLFVGASAVSSMGAGILPAIQSLALCITQARDLLQDESSGETSTKESATGTGKLFGALSTMQALGQMIIAPLLFGLIYSETVAHFPKAIFVTACSILVIALCVTMLIRNPVRRERVSSSSPHGKGKGKTQKKRGKPEKERGRSRVSKDLFGGAFGPELMDDAEYSGRGAIRDATV